MKRFVNILVVLAVILFAVWIILNFVIKGHTQAASILGILTIFVSVIGFILLQKDIHLSDSGRIVLGSMPLLAIIMIGTNWLEHTLGITWFPEAIVAYGTLLLAVATFLLGQTTKNENSKLITENKRLSEENQKNREQDKERESKRRRLDEVQHWVEKTIMIRHEFDQQSGSVNLFSSREKIDEALSRSEYIKLEAKLLDKDIADVPKFNGKYKETLEGIINKVAWFLISHRLQVNVSTTQYSEELRLPCIKAFEIISDLRAELKL